MKKVVVFGSGRVAGPLVQYLLDRPDIKLTVASIESDRAAKLVGGHPRGEAVHLEADDAAQLGRLAKANNLAISLLPAAYHAVIAHLCIEHKTHLVTASYVSQDMSLLDEMARRAGVVVLNEVGLDPGIDHMSAMQLIDRAKARGAEIISFKSYCGGLPAPDSNDNPFGYKFSWSPRGVLAAGKNSARWRESGKEVVVPGPRLFSKVRLLEIDGVGQLEAYPNRDSLGYMDRYGLQTAQTIHRGTLRYPGWCATWRKIIELGLLDESPTTYPKGTTYADFTSGFLRADPSGDLRADLAEQLHVKQSALVLDRLEWLGMFGDEPLPVTEKATTPLDILAKRMEQKLRYEPGQRDMIVLRHGFIAKFPDGHEERIASIIVDYGEPGGETAMARTVAYPVAIAARLILEGKISDAGVRIPVTPDIYDPILAELETLGIRCTEKSEPIEP